MTLWSPDTCACQVVLDDTPATAGTPLSHERVCARHAATSVDHHGVLAENQNKNKTVNALVAALPSKIPRPQVLPISYDATNKLTVTIPNTLTAAEQATAATAIANAGGVATLVVGAVTIT